MRFQKTIKILTSVLLIILFTSVSQAGKTGASGGGVIDSQTQELLDFQEARTGRGLVPFHPRNLELFKTHIYPKMAALSQESLQALGVMLLQKLNNTTNKTWYFTSLPIENQEVTKKLHILTEGKCLDPKKFPKDLQRKEQKCEVIALQDEQKIVVYKPWLDRKMNGSDNDKLSAMGLFVHEALIDYALEYDIPHDNVRHVVRAIFAKELTGTLPNSHDMLNILKNYGFYEPIKKIMQKQAQSLIAVLLEARVLIAIGAIESHEYSKIWIELPITFDNFSSNIPKSEYVPRADWVIYSIARYAHYELRSLRIGSSATNSIIEKLDRKIEELKQYPDNYSTITLD